MNKLMKKKKKGFTLIELIAVIAILAILAVVAVPRVITYVEKSKKVAVQTEASTIYNAAEAAYNDGKLTTTAKDFDNLKVKDIVGTLTDQKLLNNVKTEKLGDNIDNMTLASLKAIMNEKTEDLNVSSDGKLLGNFTTSSDGKVTYNANGN